MRRAMVCAAFAMSVASMIGGVRSVRAQPPAVPRARADGPVADSVRAFAHQMAELLRFRCEYGQGSLRARNADAVIALYGDTTHFVHVENGVTIPWAQLARSMRTFFATATSNRVRVIGEPDVAIIDRNAAVVVVTHTTDVQTGRAVHEGVWTGVLRRESGGWRIIHSHSSDRHAAAERR